MGNDKSKARTAAAAAEADAAASGATLSDLTRLVAATLKTLEIRFSLEGDLVRAEYEDFAIVAHAIDAKKMITISIAATDPEVFVPPDRRMDVAKKIAEVNFRTIPMGKMNIDLDNGRVWLSAGVAVGSLGILETAGTLKAIYNYSKAVWNREYPAIKRVGEGRAGGTKPRSAEIVEHFFRAKSWPTKRSEPLEGSASELGWLFALEYDDRAGGSILMTVKILERLPKYVKVRAICTADLHQGSVSDADCLSNMCEYISIANFALPLGAFKMDKDHVGQLRFEGSMRFAGDDHAMLFDYCEPLFDCCLGSMIKYLAGARKVVQHGGAPAEVARIDGLGDDSEDAALERLMRMLGVGDGTEAGGGSAAPPAVAVEELGGGGGAANNDSNNNGSDNQQDELPPRGGDDDIAAMLAAVAAAAGAGAGAGGAGAGAVPPPPPAASTGSGTGSGRSTVAVIDESELEFDTPKTAIGRGGFGAVYKARFCGADVAVKEALGRFSAKARRELQKEAATLAELRFPRVIQLMGVCLSGSRCSMVLEFAELGSLRSYIDDAEDEVPLNVRTRLVMDTLAGMEYLHSRKPPILHLDMKPGNVLLTAGPRAKVADFGLSRVRARATAHSTDGSAKGGGTPLFADPAQFTGARATEALDIWSLGMTLYYAFTEEDPYYDMPHLLAAGIDTFLSSVRSGVRPNMPDTLAPAVGAALAKCWGPPETRPTVKELSALIRAATSS